MTTQTKLELLKEREKGLREQLDAVSSERRKLSDQIELEECRARDEERLSQAINRISALESINSNDPFILGMLSEQTEEKRKALFRLKRYENEEI